MKKKISDKKANGFTIIELIIVISILGVIAAIAIPRLTVFKNLAEEKMCNANRKTV
ncbi:MAG: prepilin-type N-terminal cleavage/methylation domain-containing protein [Clostridiales bacterium]|nr:prepilin-type N-terminal cleavage/methylation domain-containing protein [Clostridiales bacterium]